LFTANDAHMRDLNIILPSDCIISENPEQNRQAIKLMQKALKAKVVSSDELEFAGTAEAKTFRKGSYVLWLFRVAQTKKG
jgi:isochorismate hydrolase